MTKQPVNISNIISNYKQYVWLGLFIVIVLVIIIISVIFSDNIKTNESINIGERLNINIAADVENGLYQILTVDRVADDATNLQDNIICLTGYYERAGNVTILGSSFEQGADGINHLSSDVLVWVQINEPQYSKLNCSLEEESCFGPIQVCGKFKISQNSDIGFGPDGNYLYALELPPAGIAGCINDSDCGLSICNICYNNNYLNDPFYQDDDTCKLNEGYTCICVNLTCTNINKNDLYLFDR